MSWTNTLLNKEGFLSIGGADDTLIEQAENDLKLKFADDYRTYLSNFGVASFDGHELTGICEINRLNVVSVTRLEKQFSTFVPCGFYVIEETNIDGIVIWQDANGNIYQSGPYANWKKIANSLAEYCECID